MILSAIQAFIEAMEEDLSLLEEKNFDYRADVIEQLHEFPEVYREGLAGLGDHMENRVGDHGGDRAGNRIGDRAGALRSRLEAVDSALFQRLRMEVRAGHLRGPVFKSLIGEYFEEVAVAGERFEEVADAGERPEYNNLDVFMTRLLPAAEMPVPTLALEPGMVGYYKTPAGVVLELVERTSMTSEDIFVDLGSGLGSTVLLVHLLTGVRVRGIEREPAYHAFAVESAAGLGLRGVAFVQADVREADLSDGTVFFLFTPFTGALLQEVLDRLRKEAVQRKIRVVTYGPCTAQVNRQGWLRSFGSTADEGYRLQVFCSGAD